jgi:hypothetical protein
MSSGNCSTLVLLSTDATCSLLLAIACGLQQNFLCHCASCQASANTLTAHLVSLVFLTFMIRKITAAYQKVLEWGESISKSMPKL